MYEVHALFILIELYKVLHICRMIMRGLIIFVSRLQMFSVLKINVNVECDSLCFLF
jgi:hypothetical protein